MNHVAGVMVGGMLWVNLGRKKVSHRAQCIQEIGSLPSKEVCNCFYVEAVINSSVSRLLFCNYSDTAKYTNR